MAADRICRTEGGKHPDNCPTLIKTELAEEVLAEYQKTENFEFARKASIQEKDGYSNREQGYDKVRPAKPRIEEILDFIDKRLAW